MSVGFLDLTADIDNFETPIVKNVNEFDYLINSKSEQKLTHSLQQFKVETESGWFKKNTTEELGLQFSDQYYAKRARGATDPYARITFEMSN